MTIDWTQVVCALAVPLMWAIFRAVCTWQAKTADERYRPLYAELVKAAKQQFPVGQNGAKFEYVMEQAKAHKLPADQARIEAAVHDLKGVWPVPMHERVLNESDDEVVPERGPDGKYTNPVLQMREDYISRPRGQAP